MNLCQIIWISEAVKNYTNAELLVLLTKARANNAKHGVTGLLLYHGGSFMQFMEGEADTVMSIYQNRIMRSRWHRSVTLLLQTEIPERVFSTWEMGFMTADSELAKKVPGFLDFVQTRSSFLHLIGDSRRTKKLIEEFHAGLWHLHAEPI
ncbi:MAG TPA: BLUF domain-containing protein [Opitutaceae bacterium]|nr:BLUF domain-containing protein [Opitutaceae bacterium]